MKNILIISYFYPPSNFVGGDRVAAWAKYLSSHGYYPTIITRNWNEGQKELTDKIEDNTLKHEVFDTHEIYRLPYKRTLRDKLNDYPQSKVLSVFRKMLSYKELVLQNFFLNSIPYANFYNFTKALILKEKKYHCLIVSGRPFQLFAIASKLKKTTGINWFADYRDEWNSFQNNNHSILLKFVHYLERKSELKWTKNTSGFFTVSDFWKSNISKLIHKKGFVVMNGFEKNIHHSLAKTSDDFSKLEISYIGSLYAHQPIEIFIQSVQNIIEKYQQQIKIKINFIGLSVMPDQEQRVKKLTNGLEVFFHIYDRMPKIELNEFYNNSDFLLATAFNNIKGWYPVKIFEYAASGKPILLCPTDNDVLDEFVKETRTGEIVKNQEDCYHFLQKVVEKKLIGKQMSYEISIANLEKYSRAYQTGILAKVLDENSNK